MKKFQPLSSLLVPTDFTPGAALSLERALLLPLAPGARVHLLHVLPDVPAKKRALVREAARKTLEQAVVLARKRAPLLEVSFELASGEPFVEIIRCARKSSSELIVIGRHGRRPLRDMVMGSTAQRVIRKGDVPVLAVALEPSHRYRRPCIAVDLEDTSSRIIELGLRVIGPDTAVIHAVHALHVPFEGFMTPVFSAREESEYRRTFRQTAATQLSELLAKYEQVRWRAAIHAGEPRAVLLQQLARRRSELIVLGTHARSGMAHALVGSVAEWVISAAPCDVLVGRPVRFTFSLP